MSTPYEDVMKMIEVVREMSVVTIKRHPVDIREIVVILSVDENGNFWDTESEELANVMTEQGLNVSTSIWIPKGQVLAMQKGNKTMEALEPTTYTMSRSLMRRLQK